MALYTSHFSIQFPTTPAKIPTFNHLIARTSIIPLSHRRTQSLSSILTLRANPPQKYVYPDPIPEFAEAETRKFKIELTKTLSKDEHAFGDELDKVVNVCAEDEFNLVGNEENLQKNPHLVASCEGLKTKVNRGVTHGRDTA
ncbi:protein PLASTID REDOX INSENSITIVE 2, chloroplastic isoform X4 [Beta vulgaris subsp. vulgaris]|uniref:protein PLASTID REDOX INSENSITIVE 2, chloroplastic isoform X4 n=1 Tax=Beta vulgaris subsp. vulgaris TaxID=3555 RepID=UPI0020372222|nr:protein PLASTID REDOX INSENSITIVE 2, chloroplastic isoform X4 [Beta vulgaris subsp. vulgaris]